MKYCIYGSLKFYVIQENSMKVWGDVPEELTEANCCQLELRLLSKMKAFIIYNSK